MDTATTERRLNYLEELESGRHHRGLSPKAGKQEQNRIYINAAIAAGFSESVAKNHLQKIDDKLGREEVERCWQIGYLVSLRAEKSTVPRVKMAQPVTLPGVPQVEFGNESHRQMVEIVGKVGGRALVFMKLQADPQYTSDRERMLAAGFSESQATSPGRLWKALDKIDPESVMDALHFIGVTNMQLAEILKEFFTRKETILLYKHEDGTPVVKETDRACGASVKLAFEQFFKLAQLQTAMPPGGGESTQGVLPKEEIMRLDNQMRERGMIAPRA